MVRRRAVLGSVRMRRTAREEGERRRKKRDKAAGVGRRCTGMVRWRSRRTAAVLLEVGRGMLAERWPMGAGWERAAERWTSWWGPLGLAVLLQLVFTAVQRERREGEPAGDDRHFPFDVYLPHLTSWSTRACVRLISSTERTKTRASRLPLDLLSFLLAPHLQFHTSRVQRQGGPLKDFTDEPHV